MSRQTFIFVEAPQRDAEVAHAGELDVTASPSHLPSQDLMMDRRGHVYMDVHWSGITGRACWDTGAGATPRSSSAAAPSAATGRSRLTSPG
jgi:hypothetical protein